jgi:hypothetical protein
MIYIFIKADVKIKVQPFVQNKKASQIYLMINIARINNREKIIIAIRNKAPTIFLILSIGVILFYKILIFSNL